MNAIKTAFIQSSIVIVCKHDATKVSSKRVRVTRMTNMRYVANQPEADQ